jgi:hypothetical protein
MPVFVKISGRFEVGDANNSGLIEGLHEFRIAFWKSFRASVTYARKMGQGVNIPSVMSMSLQGLERIGVIGIPGCGKKRSSRARTSDGFIETSGTDEGLGLSQDLALGHYCPRNGLFFFKQI